MEENDISKSSEQSGPGLDTKGRSFKGVWIPAELWLNEDLTKIEAAFLAEIDSLNDNGKGCFASNGYFAKFFKLKQLNSVSKIISRLTKEEYLTRKIDASGERRLMVTHKSGLGGNPTGWGGQSLGIRGGNPTGLGGVIPRDYHITYIITKMITKNIYMENLPEELGKQAIQRIYAIYALIWEEKMGFAPGKPNWGYLGKAFKPLFEEYDEWLVAALVIVHFHWKGISGADEFLYKKLSDQGFPISWIPKGSDAYMAYLRNIEGLDLYSPRKIQKFVIDYLDKNIINNK